MALVLNEEQQMLKDSARDFLQSRSPIANLRELRDGGESIGFKREFWSEIAQMGWPAINIPESYGGLEYGCSGLASTAARDVARLARQARARAGSRSSVGSETIPRSLFKPCRPTGATMPNSAKCARRAFTDMVR